MITEAFSNYNVIQGGIGQYVIAKKSFISDKLLTGEVLKLNTGIYTSNTPPVNLPDSFKIQYPPASGTYEFTEINCKNHKAFIKVVDGFNFEIEYRFFITRDYFGYFPNIPYNNGSAFDGNGIDGVLGIYLRIDGEEYVGGINISTSAFCNDSVKFDDDGFIPGEDLEVVIETQGTVSNNFYIGLIKMDSISSSVDIVPGLVQNYALIGNGVTQVEDLPYNCIKTGYGFIQQGNESKAYVTIDGSCLQLGSSYKLYAVYYQGGQWKSCISNEINQASLKAVIIPEVTILVTDEFGNTTDKACINGIGSSMDLCVTVDVTDFNAQLAAAGYTGDFLSRLEEVKVFEGNSINSSSGLPLTLVNSHPTYCTNNFRSDKSETFVIIQFTFNYPGYKDIINIAFELIYDARVIDFEFQVLDTDGPVGELCEGGDYFHTSDFVDCIILESINGSEHVESNILIGQNVDEGEMPFDDEVCMKVICEGIPTDSDCECDECADMTFTATGEFDESADESTFEFESEVGSIITVNGYTSGTNEWDTGGLGTNPFSYNIIIEKDGCVWYSSGILDKAEGEGVPIIVIHEKTIEGVGNETDCDCPEEAVECDNYASIEFTCDPDTETVSINLVRNLGSTIDEESLLYSTDGGITFTAYTVPIVSEPNIFVTYDVSFTDGCESIHLEQVIKCLPIIVCENTREITLTIVSDNLEITLTDSFASTKLTDKMHVSFDGGATYEEFDPSSSYIPLSVNGNEVIVVYTDVIFDDSCNDLHSMATLDLMNTVDPPTECPGYGAYGLEVVYDEITGEYTVNKTGVEADLVVSQLLWTLGGDNPFDDNNSGTPYYGVVKGEGLFIARWKIKLPNCDEEILTATAWGKACIDICSMPTVEVTLPEAPIEICIVECCDDVVLTIICIEEHTLHVAGGTVGDPTTLITWTGPNGFTATGNNVIITDEGWYHVTVTDNSSVPPCISTESFFHKHAESGEAIDNPIPVE